MARRVYHSFHYQRDVDRVSQVRQMGALSGQRILTPNGWEAVKKRGPAAIRHWINGQMRGRSCLVVLIGTNTSQRRWVNYEIERGWLQGLGVLGVHIHGLRNLGGKVSAKGPNPFRKFTINSVDRNMASIVPTHDPPYKTSKNVYAHISENLEDWVEEAIAIRKQYPV